MLSSTGALQRGQGCSTGSHYLILCNAFRWENLARPFIRIGLGQKQSAGPGVSQGSGGCLLLTYRTN